MGANSRRAAWAWALALLAAAFAVAWRSTHDLTWPNEHDLYRDMASAQSLVDEGYGRDPCYLGEKVWYNPLVPSLMALVHRATDLPLPVVFARGGTYLNLLAPITFFLLAARLFSGWTAVLALAGFLFAVGGAFPSWAAATYSPWIYPVNFAQAFFYLLLLRLALLRDRPVTCGWALLTGALWGLTFLAHTAPTLLFAGLLFFVVLLPALRAPGAWGAKLRPLLGPGLLLGAAAAVLVLPYAASIVGHYHLRIVNPLPNGFVPDFLGYRSIPLMLKRHLEPPMLVAWYGLYLVLRGRCDPLARRILLPWLGLTGAAVLYGYVVTGFLKVGLHLPLVVPAFHFLFYFKAAMSLTFAIGLIALGRSAAGWLARRHALALEPWAHRLSVALALALVLGNVPAYVGRYDYTVARAEAQGHARERDRIALYEWIRAHAGPDDVFLGSDDMSLFGVAPAGAKVVAVDPYMSSPYVDAQGRARDRDQMFAALAAGSAEQFRPLARAYQVTHVVAESPRCAVDRALVGPLLREVLAVGRVRLYKLEIP